MKRKGFTLIELLVVVAIIALLVSILLPALGRARELAKRVQDSAQLSGIGKAMALYQNDFQEANPQICGQSSSTSWLYFGGSAYNLVSTPTAKKRWYLSTWESLNTTSSTYAADLATAWAKYPTVGGSLYLLVIYEDLIPKMFLCPSAPSDREMDLTVATTADSTIKNWSNLRDFCSMYNLSYSYHDPFKNPSSASSSSALAVMADKNPFYDNQSDSGVGSLNLTAGNPAGTPTKDKYTNSLNHNKDGQNVLYAGSNVKFETVPNVGIGSDNIYTRWDCTDAAAATLVDDATGTKKQMGKKITAGAAYVDGLSASTEDSYLGN